MGILSFLDPVFNFLFGWLLLLPPFWAIMVISFIMAIIVVLITKLATNQNLMKRLKEEQKELQKQMKALKDKPQEMMKVQKKAMQANMKYMGQSFRPMLFTLIPILIIFGWIQGHLAYEGIMPGQEFSVEIDLAKGAEGNITAAAPEGIKLTSDKIKEITDGTAIFTFKGKAGEYTSPGLEFKIDGNSYYKEVLITEEQAYLEPVKQVRDDTIKRIETLHDKLTILDLGFVKLSWIWSYIIFSIIFSSVLRRVLKVY